MFGKLFTRIGLCVVRDETKLRCIHYASIARRLQTPMTPGQQCLPGIKLFHYAARGAQSRPKSMDVRTDVKLRCQGIGTFAMTRTNV